MSYLNFIDDGALKQLVKDVLEVGINKKVSAEKDFNKNVIDPFGALFETAAFGSDHKSWRESELIRQSQKTLQNCIGEFHQKVLGSVSGWEDKETGGIIDLVNDKHKIIAEVKNKYNTVSGGKLAEQYYSFERLVAPKTSHYKDFTAYFVNIIPKKPLRFDKPFQPSDKEKGGQCPKNERIRVIDGASFYSLVTGDENALSELHKVLPDVIEDVLNSNPENEFTFPDKRAFSEYYKKAYE